MTRPVLAAAIFLSLIPSLSLAGDVVVLLSNGNKIEASSYTIKNGKVYLKYPVGEAAIPAKQVVSIKPSDGSAELLQSEGKFIQKQEPQALENVEPQMHRHGRDDPGRLARGAPGSHPHRNADASQGSPDISPGAPPSLSDKGSDTQADALVNEFLSGDEAKQAEIANKLQQMVDSANGVGQAEPGTPNNNSSGKGGVK